MSISALDEIEKDSTTRVLVLTGEGEKAFIAGADIAHMVKLSPLEARKLFRGRACPRVSL